MEHVYEMVDALPQSDGCINGFYEDVCPVTVHVEICQCSRSVARASDIKEHVKLLLADLKSCYGDFIMKKFDDPFLTDHVVSVGVVDSEVFNRASKMLSLVGPQVELHVFQLNEDGAAQEELEEELSAASHWLLPSADFNGLWESLVFDADVKSSLLQYTSTTLLFSKHNIDSHIISWNRVILLHGPPGTGKTSLCRALAQKLSIHMSDVYTYGQLVEINSHSLFSKWFSESGKLVMKMFEKIQELIDDPQALVCVLIDEVESLTAARKSAMSGSEPSDAIRVVNAVLTQIDQIKNRPNVLILTTSNITGAIDLAFVDRADIKQYIGLPPHRAIYKILHSGVSELMLKGIISPREQLLEFSTLNLVQGAKNRATDMSQLLADISTAAAGLSGRTLRKLPFLAHALFLQAPAVRLEEYLHALHKAVKKQFEERAQLSNT